MPAARGVKRAASKSSTASAPTVPKNKKKRGAIQLEIPSAAKRRGRVLTCGTGDVGQLGLGEDVPETTKFKYVTALGDKIVDVYAGGMHTVALDSSGKVWTFGCNDEGALGRATSGDADEGTPRVVPLPAAAVALAAGDSHSAALLHNGDVYAWGAFRDSHGCMGLVVEGRETRSCREPVLVPLPERAAAIASGGDHLVILTTSGSVYTMGCGEQGQLGRLSQRSASRDARQGFSALLVPGKVTLKGGARRIWAGYHATFLLTHATDKMLAFGLNNYGQLGITGEKRKTALYSPTECDAFSRLGCGWRSVACGQHHSLALDDSGQVYSIGRCEYGRLGLGERSGDAEALEPVPKLQNKKCISIAAGTSSSFAVTDAGEVVSWGMGSEGQLGTGACADAAEPTAATPPPLPRTAAAPAAAPRAAHVAAGGQHTVILVEDPSSQKEASPVPENEEVEETEESAEEEKEEEKKPPPRKRQRKQQEEEVSSTSSVQPQTTELGEDAPPQPKVNGDEKKVTPMEVDDTDKPQETKEEKTKEEATKEDEQKDKEMDQDEEREQEPEQEDKEPSKPETTDSSSQETTDSESKSQHALEHTTIDNNKNDVDMKDDVTDVNGPRAAETVSLVVEAKSAAVQGVVSSIEPNLTNTTTA